MTTRQKQDAVREAAMLAQAREAAAQAFDARANKAGHPDTVTMERHHAKVIRQGEGDDYDAVQSALIALRLAALDSPAGEGKAESYERRQHIETLTYLQTQYLPGGPRDIKGALRAAVKSLAIPAPAVDDLDSPAARLDMVRVALSGIIDNPASAVALARAGLDFCDLTEAQRQEMRGEA
jgi:hypothetical protein